MNFANVTLGELLSNKNKIIQRNALSILRTLQRMRDGLESIDEQSSIISKQDVWKPKNNRVHKNKSLSVRKK